LGLAQGGVAGTAPPRDLSSGSVRLALGGVHWLVLREIGF
jgi:hypothetical protein